MNERDAERSRIAETDRGGTDWRRWGSYLSERAWGTVREDYSADGDAWASFPFEHAASRTYRWNEDGLAGFCDSRPDLVSGPGVVERQRPDPEGTALRPDERSGQPRRGRQGAVLVRRRHAVAFLDALAYHYPQQAFPYDELIAENARRSRLEPEYEIDDTSGLCRQPLLRRDRRLRQGGGRRPVHADHAFATRVRTPATIDVASDAVVSQHLALGAAEGAARTEDHLRRRDTGRRPRKDRHADADRRPTDFVGRARVRQRDEHAALYGVPGPRVSEGRHRRLRRSTARPP